MENMRVPMGINDIVGDNVKKLAQLFPSAVKDGEVDFEALKEELGQFREVGSEKYELTWAGKKNAKKIAQEDVFGRTLKFIPGDSKDADTTENLYIEGDNLEVLKLLRQNYYGAIKMIYIDPPYNTGNDFVYNDTFSMSKEEAAQSEGIKGEDGEQYSVNKDSSKRFHANWLSMIYARLKVAKDLLTDDGAIFISIDDNEQSNIKKLCDEIFGEYNKVAEFCVIRAEGGGMAKQVIKGHDYLYVYAKNVSAFTPLGKPKDVRGRIIERDGETYWIQEDWLRKEFGKYGNCHYEEVLECKGKDKLDEINARLTDGKYILVPKPNGMNIVGKLRNLKEDSSKFYSVIKHLSKNGIEELKTLGLDKHFSYPKPVSLIQEMMSGITLFSGKNGDIILDFFSGSATTAQAVMQLNAEDKGNRKYIMVQLPEKFEEDSDAKKDGFGNICEVGKERIRRAGDKIKSEHPDADIDIGFKVFRTADTNIKWNSNINVGQLDVTQMEYNPDLVDFMPDAKDVDIVYELMLRQRDVPLSEALEQLSDIGNRTYLYANSYLVCLETEITEKLVSKLAELNPLPIKFIFRDSAFKDDIALKDETFRRLRALIEKNAGTNKPAYTVEFI